MRKHIAIAVAASLKCNPTEFFDVEVIDGDDNPEEATVYALYSTGRQHVAVLIDAEEAEGI